MLKIALSRMASVFLPSVLMQGQAYQQKGHVLNVRISDGLLKARVKGRSGQIYDIHINLKFWPEEAARCSCSSPINCKHVAASFFALQVQENYEIPPPSVEKHEKSLSSWLDNLRKKEFSHSKIDNSHDVVYLIRPQFSNYEHRVSVRLALAKRLKKGLGKMVSFTTITESRKQFFSETDENIISALLAKNDLRGKFERSFIRNSEILEKILLTDRTYLDEENPYALRLGENRLAEVDWQLAPFTGKQQAILKTGEKQILALMLDKYWYFDKHERTIGLLNLPYPISSLRKILEIEPLSLDKAAVLAKEMLETAAEIPPPKTYLQRKNRQVRPIPVAIFNAFALPNLEEKDNIPWLFTVEIAFDYGEFRVTEKEPCNTMVFEQETILIEITRSFNEEKEKCIEIEQILGLRAATLSEKLSLEQELLAKKIVAHFHHATDLPRFYSQYLPLLEKNGWRIEFAHPIYEELITADEVEWFSELADSGNNFFSYELGILVEGKPVSIVPLVAGLITKLKKANIESLADEEVVKLALPDGKWLQVNLGRIKPLIYFLLQYSSRSINEKHPLEIARYQLILLQEAEQALAATTARWRGGELLRSQLQQLLITKDYPIIDLPQGLRATLRDYQHEGLNWLQFLRASHFGGILADDMGLGKTVQTLAHLQVEKEQQRLTRASLIVAPTSLVGNWMAEAQRFTPDLKLLVFHGAERHEDNFDDYDLIISTYGLIQRDKARFIIYPFYYLILDEAQSIKNSRTKTTQIIQQIPATHRLCLSGTPLENNLSELWSLFNFLMPGFLGDAMQFRQFFKTPIEKKADNEKRLLLVKRIQPFLLRRTKNEVARELPAKTEMIRTIELTGAQRDLYEIIRISMEKKVRDAIAKQGMGKSHIVLLDALLKLRQICCDPKLLSLPAAELAHGCSAKLEVLLELLDNLVAEGRRVLVFSQFTSMLKLIEEALILKQHPYLKLTGQTQNRHALVNAFQEGEIPIFLISLKAGGTGLNLTRADTVIHYDPWWNPAVEDQATDRSHRIGQENPVFVYKLITSGTVEEAILTMQEKKRQLCDGILSNNASGMFSLTAQDIEQLLQPLTEA